MNLPAFRAPLCPSLVPPWCRAIALLLALACGGSWAQAEHDNVRRDVHSGKLKPLADILSNVQQRHAGRIVDIDLERGADGRRWYEIKILNGQRLELYIDAVTGQEIPKPHAASPHLLSMSALLRQVQASHPGMVLKIELEDDPGLPPYYELQLLGQDGRETLLRADAQSGRILDEPPIQLALAARLQPMHQVVERLEQHLQGRAIEAELKTTRQGRSYYEVELLLETGRSAEVHVDAVSGAVVDEDELR